MDRYAVRVDMIVRAGSQAEANDFVSEILNDHLGSYLDSDQVSIVDWSYGSAGAEKYQSPVRVEDNPFGQFTAGLKN